MKKFKLKINKIQTKSSLLRISTHAFIKDSNCKGWEEDIKVPKEYKYFTILFDSKSNF